MEVGNKVLYYNKWKTQKGNSKEVLLIEFLRYKKKSGNYFYFYIKEKKYEGQIWKCKVDKKYMELTFRQEVLDVKERIKETSLIENKNPVFDKYPNPIMDSWKECVLGVIDKNLFPYSKDYLNILNTLESNEIINLRIQLFTCKDEIKLQSLYKKYKKMNLKERRKYNKIIYEILYR